MNSLKNCLSLGGKKMEPINEEQATSKVEEKKGKTPIILTSLISSTVAALVTSSVFVFASDYGNKGQTQSSDVTTQQTQTTTSNTNVKKLSTSTNTTSMADIVENASKAIVGVVNYQKETSQNLFDLPFSQQSSQNGQTVEKGTGSGVIWKKGKWKSIHYYK